MSKAKMEQLAQCGQSVWLDYISRPLLEGGKLKDLIAQGLRGLTSNPSIFHQAISKSSDYDARITELAEKGKSPFEIYDALTIRDIQDAADMFLSVYERTNGLDGYVSLEINPKLAHDAEASIKEGKRLFQSVNRPNLMIKVPATPAGFPTASALLADGINVNMTLIFSLQQYEQTAEAFLKGIKGLGSKDLSKIRSVASVFVSRIDTMVDKQLDDQSLKGKAAVANSQIIYAKSEEFFNANSPSRQRVLWGSTSTKNPDYPDIKYVSELIFPDTVNTIPEKTLSAFLDHGEAKAATCDAGKAQEVIQQLKAKGIDINEVCAQLLVDGVAAFATAFDELLNAIEIKARQLCSSTGN